MLSIQSVSSFDQDFQLPNEVNLADAIQFIHSFNNIDCYIESDAKVVRDEKCRSDSFLGLVKLILQYGNKMIIK